MSTFSGGLRYWLSSARGLSGSSKSQRSTSFRRLGRIDQTGKTLGFQYAKLLIIKAKAVSHSPIGQPELQSAPLYLWTTAGLCGCGSFPEGRGVRVFAISLAYR